MAFGVSRVVGRCPVAVEAPLLASLHLVNSKNAQSALFYRGSECVDLGLRILGAGADETGVADTLQIYDPISLLWRDAPAFLALHLDP